MAFEKLSVTREGAVLFTVIDAPPMNLEGPELIHDLISLIRQAEADNTVQVLVFKSADPDYFISHVDVTRIKENREAAATLDGDASIGLVLRHLSVSRLVTIAQIEGRVRGVGSEFVLACDMRFASREYTRLSQPEVAVGLHPGGGGTERLPHLVGRGRALEIVLGGNDFDGDTAERYGYINRALADAELDGFVDTFARRIASFDGRAIAAAKSLINQVSLPSADRLLDALNSFQVALTWPETQRRVKALLERGLQQDGDFEKGWPAVLGNLLNESHHS